jgi:hypothetical protein
MKLTLERFLNLYYGISIIVIFFVAVMFITLSFYIPGF